MRQTGGAAREGVTRGVCGPWVLVIPCVRRVYNDRKQLNNTGTKQRD